MVSARHVLGFCMLAATMCLWVGSSVFVQMIFEDVHYVKPIFMTLFNSASSACMLLPRLVQICSGGKAAHRDDGKRSDSTGGSGELSRESVDPAPPQVLRLSTTIGMLWLCAQWVFNFSLLHTSIATSTVLSSTSSVFTFVFSLVICGDPFRWLSFCAALFSFGGCTIVAMQAPLAVANDAVNNSDFGNELTLVAAAMFALVTVVLRKWAPEDFDCSYFMGMNGMLAIFLAPLLLTIADSYGIEEFARPPLKTLVCLALNALFGCTIANYFYTSALLLLSPIVATVSMSLSIPLSALVDQVLLRQHTFSAGWLVGASLVCMSVLLAAVDLEGSEESREKSGKEEKACKASELRPLLDEEVGEGEDDECYSESRCCEGGRITTAKHGREQLERLEIADPEGN